MFIKSALYLQNFADKGFSKLKHMLKEEKPGSICSSCVILIMLYRIFLTLQDEYSQSLKDSMKTQNLRLRNAGHRTENKDLESGDN